MTMFTQVTSCFQLFISFFLPFHSYIIFLFFPSPPTGFLPCPALLFCPFPLLLHFPSFSFNQQTLTFPSRFLLATGAALLKINKVPHLTSPALHCLMFAQNSHNDYSHLGHVRFSFLRFFSSFHFFLLFPCYIISLFFPSPLTCLALLSCVFPILPHFPSFPCHQPTLTVPSRLLPFSPFPSLYLSWGVMSMTCSGSVVLKISGFISSS